ncbi:hypothetical protein F966_03163 [Acinetobacter higginsii]|uniref:HTH tetR-type domain-containing protein n=1 Tax=Acinetobacter higginsii TaxID=70347 RepID=N8XHH5_9GAMM|nr:TetR/AcrR family transcriptional regulator [Acinetobacter higginsii]ENV08489.1 hypothetical protein F966_03163 [Acinetobacter higginsii]
MKGQNNIIELNDEKKSRTGGRAERLVIAIYKAVYDLLKTMNYEEIEIPEIARLAQVNKTTIYRRWSSKEGLILEVVQSKIKEEISLPNTGNLNDDLTLFLKMIAQSLETPFTLNILKASLSNQEMSVNNTRECFWNERFLLAQPLIDRAVERGELSENVQVREFFELAAGPIFYRVLIIGELVSDGDIKRIVRNVLLIFGKN